MSTAEPARALAQHYLECFLDTIEGRFDAYVERVPDALRGAGQLWEGLLGVGWTVAHAAAVTDRPGDEGLSLRVNRRVLTAVRAPNHCFDSTSLLRGTCGFLLYLCDLSGRSASGVRGVEKLVARWLASAPDQEQQERFDWTEGGGGHLGLARHLLVAPVLPEHVREQAHEVGRELLRRLVVTPTNDARWFVSPRCMGADATRTHPWFEHGQYPVGMAHGAAGLLANMSLSRAAFGSVAHLDEAIESVTSWIQEQAQLPDGTFAGVVGAGAAGRPDRLRQIVTASSWCNGSEGITAVMATAAGTATPTPACTTMTSGMVPTDHPQPVRRRPRAGDSRPPRSSEGSSDYFRNGLCHGAPGLALIDRHLGARDSGATSAALRWSLRQLSDPEQKPSILLADGTSGTAQLALDVIVGQAPAANLMLMA